MPASLFRSSARRSTRRSNMTRPLYIYDLDGTLALIDHRKHHIADKKSPRWDLFYKACVDDEKNIPVIATMAALMKNGADAWVFSGRSDEVRAETIEWLHVNTPFSRLHCQLGLEMRKEGDSTPDDVLKKGWLDAMFPEDRARLVAVFDDRDKVCKMWRANGVTCFQVAPGDF